MAIPDSGPLIVASDLARNLEDPDLAVLDCRFDLMDPAAGRAAWLEGHIPGAQFVDLDQDLAGPIEATTGRHPLPDVARISTVFGDCGIGEDSRVVVYDASNGALAARCWWLLRWLGHDAVAVLDGGYDAWTALGAPVESGEVTATPRDFRGVADDARVMTTEDVVDAIADDATFRLLDARDAARFRGEVEPIDPVAGHVPGATNLPFTAALGEDGRWRSPAELEHLFQGTLGDDPDVAWTTMCGSGVTACHLAISALLAGYREPRLYVGSWSEWIRDPSRQLVTGN